MLCDLSGRNVDIASMDFYMIKKIGYELSKLAWSWKNKSIKQGYIAKSDGINAGALENFWQLLKNICNLLFTCTDPFSGADKGKLGPFLNDLLSNEGGGQKCLFSFWISDL